MKLFIEILKGMVIGLANIIPGVSGGTMMVSMGIYDNLIYSITHLFKEFKKAVRILFPYAVGMVVAIATLSFALKWAFAEFPLPTNTLFIGLILGGLPAILKQIKGEKTGIPGVVLFIIFFAVVVMLTAVCVL
jgi:putative membrane protein